MLLSNKQSVKKVLIQRAVKTTIQILYDRGYLKILTKQKKFQKFFWFLIDVDLI